MSTLENWRAVVSQSDDYYRAGDLDRAAALLQPLVAKQVNYFRPYYNLGFLHWLRADYAAALPLLEKSASLLPKFADGHLLLGKVATAVRRYERALQAITAYRQLDGVDPSATLWEARALWGLGRVRDANAKICAYATEFGWSTMAQKDFRFAQEPWFLSHLQNWRKHLATRLGRVQRALEIGNMEGMSAVWIAEHLLAPRGRLEINDIEFRDNLVHNIESSGYSSRIDLRLGDSAIVLPSLPTGAYDFIYVDGDHSAAGVFRDCVNATVLAAEGAIVILDDYGKANESTRLGIDLFLGLLGDNFTTVDKGYQIMLQCRGGPVLISRTGLGALRNAVTDNTGIEMSSGNDTRLIDMLRRGGAKIPERSVA